MYWEDRPGRTQAPYLRLCQETVERNGGLPVVVVGRDSAHDYVELDGDRWRDLPSPVYRSDYLRTRLLHAHGGLWVDSDTIVLEPLSSLLEPLHRYEIVGFGEEAGGRLYNGLLAGRRGSELMGAWMDAQDEAIEGGLSSYAELGQDISWSMIAPGAGYWPLARVAPVMWWEWRRFASRLDSPARVLAADPVTVVLWNSAMDGRFGSLDESELLGGRTLLSRLLRIALGRSTRQAEETVLTRLAWLDRVRFSGAGRSVRSRVLREQ